MAGGLKGVRGLARRTTISTSRRRIAQVGAKRRTRAASVSLCRGGDDGGTAGVVNGGGDGVGKLLAEFSLGPQETSNIRCGCW